MRTRDSFKCVDHDPPSVRAVNLIAGLAKALDGEVFAPDAPGYDAARRVANVRFRDVRPHLVVLCCSAADVVAALRYARENGSHVVARGGGHCFAGRSSTEGIVLDLSPIDEISVTAEGIATIGAGARLARVYSSLSGDGRTLPAGCGATVGIAGLTLGGGIGLLGRTYGLTCDRLVAARAVLADGRVVVCDSEREPDLFWALRGAGGGQFGVVTSLTFATVAEPAMTRFEGHWSGPDLEELVAAWQVWAPNAAEGLTANLTLVAAPGRPVRATVFGASLLDGATTRHLLGELSSATGGGLTFDARDGIAYGDLKDTFDELDPRVGPEPAVRIRSEFFSQPMQPSTTGELVAGIEGGTPDTPRQLTFTAMGGAYNRPTEAATAFAHRNERFLLEHVAEPADPWLDRSWAIAHADGSGRVYPNFPDPDLHDWPAAYHAGNIARLTDVKDTFDPDRLFHFPQSL
jgi:FAD/FMN-containing dehydrogenase